MKKNLILIIISIIVLALCLTACLSDDTDALSEYPTDGITEDGFKFHIEDGKAALWQYTGTQTDVKIPSAVNGFPVQSIDTIFEDNKTLVSVTLPDGLKKVGRSAFKGCTALTQVVIPNSVNKIETNAFKDCTALAQIVIPNSVKEIEEFAFGSCTALQQVTLAEDVRLESGVFYDTPWLNNKTGDFVVIGVTLVKINLQDSHIDIPDNVKNINLENPTDTIESVFLPKSLCSIGQMLYGEPNIKSVTVDEDNASFSAVDGVLYNKDKTIMLYYPAKKTGEVFEADKNLKMIFEGKLGRVQTVILPEDFLIDFNSLATILQSYETTQNLGFAPRQDSTDKDYWQWAFLFVYYNQGNRDMSRPYFENLYFRSQAPQNVDGINSYLEKLDSQLNIVWGYEG